MCRVNGQEELESGGDPKQGREAESQKWSWVEAEVWTERMLTSPYFIEQGLFTMAVAHAQIPSPHVEAAPLH